MLKLIPILYEDDYFVVFDKPAGLIVIPSPDGEPNTLVSIVNNQYREGSGHPRFYPCHRLDRETSGVIIFSKGKKNQKRMMDVFRAKAVQKKYIAFVNGHMPKKKGEFKSPIQSLDRQKYKKDAIKKAAITQFKVKEEYELFSVLEVNLITGRPNQIRIHFSQQGFPLVGERKYAVAKRYPLKFRRVALHAFIVEWIHPVTHQKIMVKSDLHKDMEDFILNNSGNR